MPSLRKDSRGTVSLVALCFVAVIGLVLASYLTVSSRAMNLSNRSYQAALGQQLAELGLEEALRAFNQNRLSGIDATAPLADWTNAGFAVDWSLDPANKRANATLTFPAGKFGQGIAATVKIRVDNYDAAQLASSWSATAHYQPDDVVGQNGTWYRCVKANPTSAPDGITNLDEWVPNPMPNEWGADISYHVGDAVFYQGFWRRCWTAHTSTPTLVPTDASYWITIPSVHSSVVAGTTYLQNAVAYDSSVNTWVHRLSTGLGSDLAGWAPAPVSWRWDGTKAYAFNDVVYHAGSWFRCISPAATTGDPTTDSTHWGGALTGMWGWAAGLKYNVGDVVYYGTQWYRCLVAHTSLAGEPPDTVSPMRWSNAPRFSSDWQPGRRYSDRDTVLYRGAWYLSLANFNKGNRPDNSPLTWIAATTNIAGYRWSATTAYNVDDIRSYGDVWYRCVAGNTGEYPGNPAFWTPTWTNSFGISTGASVIYAETTLDYPNNPALRTQLRAVVQPAPLFPNALAARETLSLGSGGTIESYDSVADPTAASPGFSAVVAAGATTGTAATITSTVVKGYVAAPAAATSPFAPLAAFGSSAVVKGTPLTPLPKVDVSRLSRSPFVPAFDPHPAGGVVAAFAASDLAKGEALVLEPTTNIGTPGASAPARYFYNGNLTIGTGTIQFLNINGPVVLYINGDLTVTAVGYTGRITVNRGGEAEIHVGGSLRMDVAGEGVNNLTLDPRKVILICDSLTSDPQYYSDGSFPFYGTIYAPYTGNVNGFFNDNTNVNIFGAVSARNITYSGANANVHFDTSLRYASFGGVDQPYAVVQWRPLPRAEQTFLP